MCTGRVYVEYVTVNRADPRVALLALWIFFFLFLWVLISSAQTTFQQVYGGAGNDVARCVQRTSDGGYILAGYTNSSGAGGEDAYVICTDADGNLLWDRTFGGAANDRANFVRQTSDNGFIIAGRTASFGTGTDAYLVKVNSAGTATWSRVFGGTNEDIAVAVDQTSDGGYVLTGHYNYKSFPAIYPDVFMVKTDADGNTGGAGTFSQTFGGTGFDAGQTVKQNGSGYLIGAYSNSFSGGYNACLIQADASGNFMWAVTYGGAGDDAAHAHAMTADGGIVLTGHTTSFGAGGPYDVYLIKTGVEGDVQWSKVFGTTDAEDPLTIQQTSDNGYVIAAETGPPATIDVLLMKADNAGDLQWSFSYGGSGSEYGYWTEQTPDNGFVIAGYTTSFGPAGNNVYLIKTDANGNTVACSPAGIVLASGAHANTVSGQTVSVTARSAPVSAATAPGTPSLSGSVICSGLPLEIVSFYAERTGSQIVLSWTAESDRHVDYYVMERKQGGEGEFVPIGMAPALQDDAPRHDYMLTDNSPANTRLYYRIRQVGLNGDVYYSATVEMTPPVTAFTARSVYRKADDAVYVDMETPHAGAVRYSMLDLTGKELRSGSHYASQPGPLQFRIEVSDITEGLYFLEMSSCNHVLTDRVRIY